MIKILKKITLYNNIIKLKTYWLSHIAVIGLYLSEFCMFILTIYETIIEKIDLNNGIVPDYVLGFNTCLLLNQLIGFILLGFFEITLFIIFFIFKFLFKKAFIVKSQFLMKNHIYHIIWLFGIYMVSIIAFCVFIYLIIIAYEGITWFLDK